MLGNTHLDNEYRSASYLAHQATNWQKNQSSNYPQNMISNDSSFRNLPAIPSNQLVSHQQMPPHSSNGPSSSDFPLHNMFLPYDNGCCNSYEDDHFRGYLLRYLHGMSYSQNEGSGQALDSTSRYHPIQKNNMYLDHCASSLVMNNPSNEYPMHLPPSSLSSGSELTPCRSSDPSVLDYSRNIPTELPRLIPIELPNVNSDCLLSTLPDANFQVSIDSTLPQESIAYKEPQGSSYFSDYSNSSYEDIIDPVGLDQIPDEPQSNSTYGGSVSYSQSQTYFNMDDGPKNGGSYSHEPLGADQKLVSSRNTFVDKVPETPEPSHSGAADNDRNDREVSTTDIEGEEIPQFNNIPDWMVRWRRKAFKPKACGVCRKLARSSHFGGICCDSCKAFFRRAVKNDTILKFICAYDGKCDVVGDRRKTCQSCRFNKCLSIGMKVKWVARDNASCAENSSPVDGGDSMLTIIRFNGPINSEDKTNISVLLQAYSNARKGINIPDKADFSMSLQTFHKILVAFTQNIGNMCMIHDSDWHVILRFTWVGAFLIRLVRVYDAEKRMFPHCKVALDNLDANPTANGMVDQSKGKEIFNKVFDMTHRMYMAKVDDAASLLLALIHMMDKQPNTMLRNDELVVKMQDHLLNLLKQHLVDVHGSTIASHLYPLLLTRLADFREYQDMIVNSMDIPF